MKKPHNAALPHTDSNLMPTHRPPARKALGQYFLVDRSVLEQILSAAELSQQGLDVISGMNTSVYQDSLNNMVRFAIKRAS